MSQQLVFRILLGSTPGINSYEKEEKETEWYRGNIWFEMQSQWKPQSIPWLFLNEYLYPHTD